MRLPLLVLVLMLVLAPARAAEPFFKKGDVIALVGGEDMVVASEYGYLELLLVRALPDYRLRFRNLAWEGDTVFEQRRDLNFPTWEEQFDKIRATVVIAQFGQMESLAGKETLPEFIEAYEKLIERFSSGGKRRVVLLSPFYNSAVASAGLFRWQKNLESFYDGSRIVSKSRSTRFVDLSEWLDNANIDGPISREGVHLNEEGEKVQAIVTAQALVTEGRFPHGNPFEFLGPFETEPRLRQLIIAKNRLWFDYWRPQNWAFLAGDRTAQPSSRDHLDPSKRWFPPEREAFLPLIEAKEKEIDALARKLAQP